MDAYIFNIEGNLIALGNETDSIRCYSDPGIWGGMMISNENPGHVDSLRFAYCVFMHGDQLPSGLDKGGAVGIENGANVVFRHCHFKDNQAMDKGGAVYINNSFADFRDCVFESNKAINGGAIYSNNSSPKMLNCEFRMNSSWGGGGALVFHESGQPIIRDCYFELSAANGSGGAIAFLENIHTQLERCEFFQNTAQSDIYLADGGAVLITPYDNEVSFFNCRFDMNYAEDYGGGLYVTSPTNVIGCLFNGNFMPGIVPSFGGAITVAETSMRIINSTFMNNEAMLGPTVFIEDAELLILNSILWDENGSDPAVFISTNVNPPSLYVDNNDVRDGQANIWGPGDYQLYWGEGNIDADPHFISPGDDFSLAWNSPCINAGRTDTLQLLIPAEDIAGNPRIMGGEIDMGCYEYQGPVSIPEISSEKEFLVYPNPAKEYFYLRSGLEEDFNGKLMLTDLSGREILVRDIKLSTGQTFRQSLPSVPSGLYIIHLISDDLFISKKLLLK